MYVYIYIYTYMYYIYIYICVECAKEDLSELPRVSHRRSLALLGEHLLFEERLREGTALHALEATPPNYCRESQFGQSTDS